MKGKKRLPLILAAVVALAVPAPALAHGGHSQQEEQQQQQQQSGGGGGNVVVVPGGGEENCVNNGGLIPILSPQTCQ